MSAQPKHYYTPEEYLAFEDQSEQRHEYLDGDIIAMVGASRRHRKIQTNLLVALHPELRKGDCWIYANDARIQPTKTAYFYPDLVIECGETVEADQHEIMLPNPVVIIEVLSSSTMNFDRGEKFLLYQMIPSLQTYILVSQDTPRIEQYDRSGATWVYRNTEGLEAVFDIASVQCSLRLAQVYEDVIFDAAEDDESKNAR